MLKKFGLSNQFAKCVVQPVKVSYYYIHCHLHGLGISGLFFAHLPSGYSGGGISNKIFPSAIQGNSEEDFYHLTSSIARFIGRYLRLEVFLQYGCGLTFKWQLGFKLCGKGCIHPVGTLLLV
jgi:hypothetical protein